MIEIDDLDTVLKGSYPPWVKRDIVIPNIDVYEALKVSSEKYGSLIAIDFFGKKITYTELKSIVDTVAFRLSKIGILKGDRVAVMLPNIPQYIIYFFAILKIGAIVVQVNPLYTERELEYEIKDSGAEHIIVMDEFVDKASAVKQLKKILVVKLQTYLPFSISLVYNIATLKNHKKIKESPKILKETNGENGSVEKAEIDPVNDVALFQYTGGTTGKPKAAMLTHKNLIANAYQIIESLPEEFREKISYLSAIPYFHVYGMMTAMLAPVIQGAKIILIPDPRNTKLIISTMEKKKPVAFPGIPSMYHSIVTYKDVKKYNINNVKICISGASPLPVELQKQFEDITGAILVEGYGLTESSPVANITPIVNENRDSYARPGSVGLPVPNTYQKIVSVEDGKTEMDFDEPGELLIKGPQVMKGYWNRDEENKNVLTDGWLHTGDIAKIGKDGYVYIVDRKKDLIIAGGYNIYPREVEDVIYENEKVSLCAVIGVPDVHRGETVKAFIVKNDNSLTEDEIRNFCKERLSVYKVPKLIEFRDDLPMTLVGKIDKKQLRNNKT